MIGNDIVDLKVAAIKNNWKRPGFLSKICTAEEQHYITSSEDKSKTIWRIWSMKEAAYKAHQRLNNLAPKFNPKAFNCVLVSPRKGKVIINSKSYKTSTKFTSGYIYSEAVLAFEKVKKTTNIQNYYSSGNLKNELLKSVSNYPGELKIEKCKNRIPRIFNGEEALEIHFSITHHGNYSAFVLAEF